MAQVATRIPLIALLDMDGTIADYEFAMRRDLERLRAPEEPPFGENLRELSDTYPHIRARRDLIRNTPGWWASLPRCDLGWDVLEEHVRLGFDIHVLTKGPESSPNAFTEKVLWCQRELGVNVPVTLTSNKSLVWGATLTDDWTGYFVPWLRRRRRAFAIVPARPWNVDVQAAHPDVAARIVRYDGSNMEEVRDALRFTKDRVEKMNAALEAQQ